jgi:hypothetical protein
MSHRSNRLWTEQEFWAMGLRVGPCLEWQGWRNPKGYGYFETAGRRWKASRWAWTITHGPIPDGLLVCHTCDNPPCIEPLHLFLGTNRDNLRDMAAKGRTHRHLGETNRSAKLTTAQVRVIRAVRQETGVTVKSLAQEYGVHQSTIEKILARETWKDVA